MVNLKEEVPSQEKDKNSEELLTTYIQQNFNKIQYKIVQLLKDFSIQKPALLIKGFLKVWDANMNMESKDGKLANHQN